MNISQFIIDNSQKALSIRFIENEKVLESKLSFEYLRISSPAQNAIKPGAKQNIISHKKDVQLNKIERVGKHGYRLIFNDNHNAIFSEDYLKIIANNVEERWQQYLAALKASGHTREAMIDFKQV